MSKNLKPNKGFSLIEISVVILILAILVYGISTGIDLYRDAKISIAKNLTAKSPVPRISELSLWLEASDSQKIECYGATKTCTNNGKIKIYSYGDSHSRDLFLILRLSEKITKLYEFALDDFDGADAILYTRQFYEEMLKDFEKHDIFTKAKAEKKKIIIIGRTAEFYTGNIDPLVFNLIQDPNSLNAYENNNKGFIDKNFYNILRDDVIKINKQLKIKAKEMGALYIDRVDLGCDIIKQVCHSMTTDGYPIYWDHSHLTWQGVNFFSNLVDKKNWFGPVEEFLKKDK